MNKKKPNLFFRILNIFIIVFAALYIALESGYYESKLSKEAALTEESIRKFEEDVKNNKVINVDSYLTKEKVDYSTGFSTTGEKLTNSLATFVASGLTKTFAVLKSLFW